MRQIDQIEIDTCLPKKIMNVILFAFNGGLIKIGSKNKNNSVCGTDSCADLNEFDLIFIF